MNVNAELVGLFLFQIEFTTTVLNSEKDNNPYSNIPFYKQDFPFAIKISLFSVFKIITGNIFRISNVDFDKIFKIKLHENERNCCVSKRWQRELNKRRLWVKNN